MAQRSSKRSPMYADLPTSSTNPQQSFRMHWWRQGQGPDVLYVAGSGRSLSDRPNVFDSPLTESCSVISYDQRGLGKSGAPPGDWTMGDFADDAAAVLSAAGVGSCAVIGVSFGGMVAQELAIRFPPLVELLVLVATSPGGAGGRSYQIHELENHELRARFELELELADARRGGDWRRSNPDELERLWQLSPRREGVQPVSSGQAKQRAARLSHDCWDRLPEIDAPTLVCAGRFDGVAPLARSEAIVNRLRNGRL